MFRSGERRPANSPGVSGGGILVQVERKPDERQRDPGQRVYASSGRAFAAVMADGAGAHSIHRAGRWRPRPDGDARPVARRRTRFERRLMWTLARAFAKPGRRNRRESGLPIAVREEQQGEPQGVADEILALQK